MSETVLAIVQVMKNALAACVLPPVPLLVLALAGAWLAGRRRALGVGLAALSCAGLWLASCEGLGAILERVLLAEPPALSAADRAALSAAPARGEPGAIVVLGAGMDAPAPEYGRPTPVAAALERVRYGAWLSRATGLPLAMSGGSGWSSPQARASGAPFVTEADAMGDIAAQEFGCPVRWRESGSRDTRENARNTVALLAPQGVRTLVVVTHGWHMPRALREFRAAASRQAPSLRIVAAPMGLAGPALAPPLAWVPSTSGYERVHRVLREVLASLVAP